MFAVVCVSRPTRQRRNNDWWYKIVCTYKGGTRFVGGLVQKKIVGTNFAFPNLGGTKVVVQGVVQR